MKKAKIFVAIILYVILILIGDSDAAYLQNGIDAFPKNYQGYLNELKARYPNWNFTALYTNTSWNDVILNENVFGKNLVPISYSDRWKNTNPNEYNVLVDGNWVDASKKAIEFAMDPRNFLNEVRIFQFEKLSYDPDTNSKASVEKILYGTEFYNRLVDYLDYNGNRIYTNNYYSDLILNAARISNVSSFHLASRIKQEVGPFLSHSSISGEVEGYRGLYNFYNIGATSSSIQMDSIKKGLQYARDGKGASSAIKNKYLIPWNTKEKSITGGAIFIGSSYINKGQNTIYLQKFHVFDNIGQSLYNHQYMTNVLAAYSEAKSIYTGYVNSNLLNNSINFIIPVYYSMPEIPIENPSINPSDYIQDSQRVLANVTTSLNIRSGPSTSYESITRVGSKTQMTRISKSIATGELWDRVVLDNGIVGYAYRTYLYDVQEDINGYFLEFNNLKISKNEITGLNNARHLVSDIKNNINSNYTLQFENKNGKVLGNSDPISTGSVLKIISNTGQIIAIYKFILYGDVNGDGYIDSIDLLVLQRHVLEIEPLKDEFYKAGNTNKDGANPSSIDLLIIQRHILEIQSLEQ